MAKLIITSEEDLSGIDTVVEGALEVLKDDGNEDSPMAEDYNLIWTMMHGDVKFDTFPVEINLDDYMSGESLVLLREVIVDCADTFDDEFNAKIVE